MHFSKLLAAVSTAAGLLLGVTQTNAALINYSVSGTITETSAGVSAISVGDPFSVDAIVETASVDFDASGTLGAYFLSVTEFSFSIGAFSGGSNTPNGITMVKNGDSGVDGLNFILFPSFGDTPDGLPFGSVQLFLEDADLALLSSDNLGDALAADSNLFQDLRRAEFGLGIGGEGGFPELVAGSIAFERTQRIPEPSMLGVFAIGIVGLGILGRRRKCRALRN